MIELRSSNLRSEDLRAHLEIPITFTVDRILVPKPGGGPLDLEVQPVAEPWIKDYDQEPGADPALWPSRFDTSAWHVITARDGTVRVGGLVIFANVPSVEMLEGRADLALIWDLRVAPPYRGQGIGTRLVSVAVEWAKSQGCRELKVETQNVNVPACEFYQRRGFMLRSVRAGVYPRLPDELEMLWYREVG